MPVEEIPVHDAVNAGQVIGALEDWNRKSEGSRQFRRLCTLRRVGEVDGQHLKSLLRASLAGLLGASRLRRYAAQLANRYAVPRE